jgi:hypothetical protein
MLRSLGAFLLLALVAQAGALADTRQAQFLVHATVPARATLAAVEQPSHLRVSEADLVRGYVDVPARYVVESNTRIGCLLRLSPRLGITRHVEVRGLSTTLVVQGDGVEVFRSRTGGAEHLELAYRFVLAPGVEPGTYELPIHVAVTPL